MINISVISLRFTDTDHDHSLNRNYILLLVATVASSALIGVAVALEWPYSITLPCVLPLAACFVLLYLLTPKKVFSSPNLPCFTTPLVPFVPMFGVVLNVVMIVQLGVLPFVQVLVWTAVGCVIYFVYGIRHSKMNFMDSAHRFYY